MARNAVQDIRDRIENGIVSGDFRPGERLDEQQLAQRFGVSRTPVREALMQLSAIGFVEIRPRRGAVVIELGPQRIFEMFEVMAELEGMAGALAARRLDADDRTRLRKAHDDCRGPAENGETDAYYYANEVFHRTIYEASRSTFLADQCMTLHRRLRPYRRLQLRVNNRLRTSFAEHGAIVEAILSGDAESARDRLRAHVIVQGDRFSDLVASVARLTRGKVAGEAG